MIGIRIKQLRKEKALSQQVFADMLTTSSGHISELENGKKLPGSDFLLSLMRVFSISIDWLLIGEGEMLRKDRDDTYIYKDALDEDPVVSELLVGARKVLKSGNQVAFEALERNIRYFAHAIEMEKRMTTIESDLAAMKRKQERWEKDYTQIPPTAEAPAIKKAM